MPPSVTLLGLPSELHTEIVKNLSFPDNANLKRTCTYFQDLIQFRHAEQIEAETSPYAMAKNVYACVGCQRLRPAPMFADNMLRAKRRKGGVEASKRFCVECGTTTQKTIQGYSPGAHISIQGVHHVICLRCRRFDRGAQDEQGINVPYCLPCMAANERFQMALQQRQEEYRMVEEQRRLRQEHEQRRAARRAFWGSDHDEDSDGLEPSPTWRDLAMDIIQAEADTYMNSPKAGSE
ncbi:hypothetical protein FOVG_01377 [Fusarium oxysporum f. sp. pisi HDV247]|uniref:F-box domain-containing protein n=1 Tax=Fusarium oxysporum f. sp. pisi HDV247 TaxID=1080344 RepID=W9Q7W9_FUSOX|nr:hypothetical protein FOVG_01377 [Fusarium oxysporum f. sp. pisi HDV247]